MRDEGGGLNRGANRPMEDSPMVDNSERGRILRTCT